MSTQSLKRANPDTISLHAAETHYREFTESLDRVHEGPGSATAVVAASTHPSGSGRVGGLSPNPASSPMNGFGSAGSPMNGFGSGALELASQLALLTMQADGLHREIENLDSGRSNVFNALQTARAHAEKTLTRLHKQEKATQARIHAAAERGAELRGRLAAAEAELEALESARHRDSAAPVADVSAERTAAVAAAEREGSLQMEAHQLSQRLAVVRGRMTSAGPGGSASVASLEETAAALHARLSATKAHKEALLAKVAALTSENEALAQKAATLSNLSEADVDAARADCARADAARASLVDSVVSLEADVLSLQRRAAEVRVNAGVKAALDKQAAALSAAAAASSRHDSVKAALELLNQDTASLLQKEKQMESLARQSASAHAERSASMARADSERRSDHLSAAAVSLNVGLNRLHSAEPSPSAGSKNSLAGLRIPEALQALVSLIAKRVGFSQPVLQATKLSGGVQRSSQSAKEIGAIVEACLASPSETFTPAELGLLRQFSELLHAVVDEPITEAVPATVERVPPRASTFELRPSAATAEPISPAGSPPPSSASVATGIALLCASSQGAEPVRSGLGLALAAAVS